MAQPVYERSPSNSYKFNHSISEYAQQTPAQSNKINQLLSGPHSMNRREDSTKHRMSRLEMMKIDYQQKLLKEKEDKLSQYHVATQNGQPQKTDSGGTVREFFAERRAMEAQKNASSLPPIQLHFNRVKGQKNQAIPAPRQRGISQQQEAFSESTRNSSHSLQRKQSNQQTMPSHQAKMPAEIMTTGKSGATRRFDSRRNMYQGQKRSKGIDKQDPLPPLHKGSRKNSDKPPTPNKRYETYADLTKQDNESDETHSYVPTPPKEARPVKKRPRAPLRPVSVNESEDENVSVCTDDTPPKLGRLKAKAQLQKQLSLQKMNTNRKQGKAELSDFQKWQMEQDQVREERLDQFKNKKTVKPTSNREDSDKSSDLAKREQKLMGKIRHEQARLERLQNERQRLEEQEKQEAQAEDEWALKLLEAATTTNNKEVESAPEPIVSPREKTVKYKQKKSEQHIDEGTKEEIPAETDEQPNESYTNFYAQAAAQAQQVQDEHVVPCSVCGRSFTSDRLVRHEKVCAKNSKSKRKTFNSTKQRALGTEYEKYVASGMHKQEPEKKAKKVDWRVQHENFIKTIRYAKGASEEPPPPTENPEYIQCPHCNRKFNPYTAERHIPKCKDIKARPAPLKKK